MQVSAGTVYMLTVWPYGVSWCGTAAVWMVPAGTMDTLASMVYGVWSTVLWMVVGLTPTEQASTASVWLVSPLW